MQNRRSALVPGPELNHAHRQHNGEPSLQDKPLERSQRHEDGTGPKQLQLGVPNSSNGTSSTNLRNPGERVLAHGQDVRKATPIEHAFDAPAREERGDQPATPSTPVMIVTFDPFQRLAIELRLAVWEFAIPEPRVVHLLQSEIKKSTSNGSNGVGFKSHAPIPAMLIACKESYAVATKHYKKAFAYGNTGIAETWFDFKRDTLLISEETVRPCFRRCSLNQGHFTNIAITTLNQISCNDLRRVENLAVSAQLEFQCFRGIIGESYAVILALFGGVKHMHVVYEYIVERVASKAALADLKFVGRELCAWAYFDVNDVFNPESLNKPNPLPDVRNTLDMYTTVAEAPHPVIHSERGKTHLIERMLGRDFEAKLDEARRNINQAVNWRSVSDDHGSKKMNFCGRLRGEVSDRQTEHFEFARLECACGHVESKEEQMVRFSMKACEMPKISLSVVMSAGMIEYMKVQKSLYYAKVRQNHKEHSTFHKDHKCKCGQYLPVFDGKGKQVFINPKFQRPNPIRGDDGWWNWELDEDGLPIDKGLDSDPDEEFFRELEAKAEKYKDAVRRYQGDWHFRYPLTDARARYRANGTLF